MKYSQSSCRKQWAVVGCGYGLGITERAGPLSKLQQCPLSLTDNTVSNDPTSEPNAGESECAYGKRWHLCLETPATRKAAVVRGR